jgi:hypothetical protein
MPTEIQLGHRRTGARNEGKEGEGGHHGRSSVEEEKAEGADVHGPDPRQIRREREAAGRRGRERTTGLRRVERRRRN